MSPDDFRRLVAAGLDNEQIALVMEMMAAKEKAFAEAEEARKAKGRERVAKWREAHKDGHSNVTETQPNVTEPLTRDRVAPVDDKPITTDTTNSKNTTARDLGEFRDALAALGSDRLDAMVKVRKAKKAPLNAYAARLFIKAANTCELSLEDAADMCIERNWLTVKPDWIKPQTRGSPPPSTSNKPRNIFEASTAILAELREAENGTEPDQNGGRLEQNVRYLAAAQR